MARAEFDAPPTEGAGALEERARAVRAYPKRSRPLSIAASTLCRIKLSASTPWPVYIARKTAARPYSAGSPPPSRNCQRIASGNVRNWPFCGARACAPRLPTGYEAVAARVVAAVEKRVKDETDVREGRWPSR